MLRLDRASVEFPVRLKSYSAQPNVLGGKIVEYRGRQLIRALSDVSFSAVDGDRVAVLGRNGAGKSTFLRLCAGIYRPTSGEILIEGVVSTLFHGSLGLNIYNTGRKNITLGLKLLGTPRSKIPQKIQDIEEFCELGRYLDLPMATYSAGMRARLSFAIATSIESDILLVDEVIGAGDQKFINAASKRIEDLLQGARILILASHSAPVVRQFCNKALWLDRGEVRLIGEIEEVLEEYENQESDPKLVEPKPRPLKDEIGSLTL